MTLSFSLLPDNECPRFQNPVTDNSSFELTRDGIGYGPCKSRNFQAANCPDRFHLAVVEKDRSDDGDDRFWAIVRIQYQVDYPKTAFRFGTSLDIEDIVVSECECPRSHKIHV